MITLGQKHGMPKLTLGHTMGVPHGLGQKVEGASKNYLMNIQNQNVHRSPVEKLARSSQALGQYA